MERDPRTERLTVSPEAGMGVTRPNLTKARGQRTREVILDEATALFSTYGYRGTSLRDISERVGISHPGMLHHFSNKEALLQAVLDRAYEQFEDMLDSLVTAAETVEGLRDWRPRAEDKSVMFAVVRGESQEESHPGRPGIVKMQVMAEEKLTGMFEHYRNEGWLAEGTDPEWAARALIALWTGVFVREGLFADNRYEYDLSMFLRAIIPPLAKLDPLV